MSSFNVNPWEHLNPFEPGTLIRADAANTKFDGIAENLSEITNTLNSGMVKMPDGFEGNPQVPDKTLPNSFFYVNSDGNVDVMPYAILSRMISGGQWVIKGPFTEDFFFDQIVTDQRNYILDSDEPITFTVGRDANENQIGTVIRVTQQGEGQIEFLAQSGVLLDSSTGLFKTRQKNAVAVLYYQGRDKWILTGEIEGSTSGVTVTQVNALITESSEVIELQQASDTFALRLSTLGAWDEEGGYSRIINLEDVTATNAHNITTLNTSLINTNQELSATSEFAQQTAADVEGNTLALNNLSNAVYDSSSGLSATNTLAQEAKTTAEGNASALTTLGARVTDVEENKFDASSFATFEAGYVEDTGALFARASLQTSIETGGELRVTGAVVNDDGVSRTILFQGDKVIFSTGGVTRTGDQINNELSSLDDDVYFLNEDLWGLQESLGDLAYEDLIEKAKLGETVIQGGFLRTDLIEAGSISANLLSANAIDGKTITGAWFRTSVTGHRVEVDGRSNRPHIYPFWIGTNYTEGNYALRADTAGNLDLRSGVRIRSENVTLALTGSQGRFKILAGSTTGSMELNELSASLVNSDGVNATDVSISGSLNLASSAVVTLPNRIIGLSQLKSELADRLLLIDPDAESTGGSAEGSGGINTTPVTITASPSIPNGGQDVVFTLSFSGSKTETVLEYSNDTPPLPPAPTVGFRFTRNGTNLTIPSSVVSGTSWLSGSTSGYTATGQVSQTKISDYEPQDNLPAFWQRTTSITRSVTFTVVNTFSGAGTFDLRADSTSGLSGVDASGEIAVTEEVHSDSGIIVETDWDSINNRPFKTIGTGLSTSGDDLIVTNPFNPTGTYSGLRAQATTKADVGLSGIPNTNGSTTQYLRGDGTWVTPPNTTYSAGAGLSLSGTTFTNTAPHIGTNLGSSGTGTTRTITSSTGSNTSISFTKADLGLSAVPNIDFTSYGFSQSSGISLGTQNLNNITAAGIYSQNLNVNATSARNYPPTAVAGILRVYRAGNLSSGAAGVIQIYEDYLSGRTHKRGSSDGVSWNAWHTYYDTTNKPTAADVGAVPTARTITAGTGLTGGGTLAADRTLSVDSSVIRTTGNQTIGGVKTFTGVWRSESTAGAYVQADTGFGARLIWYNPSDGGGNAFGLFHRDAGNFEVVRNGSWIARFSANGNFTANGLANASDFVLTSDRKLKSAIQPIQFNENDLDFLHGCTYIKKGSKRREAGTIAQDWQKILPESVTDVDGTLHISSAGHVAYLVEAVKHARNERRKLEQELRDLKDILRSRGLI